MPTTPDQWLLVVGKAENNLEKSKPLISAYKLSKVAPVGLDASNQTYQSDMSVAQRNALAADFYGIIDDVIAKLTAARTAP